MDPIISLFEYVLNDKKEKYSKLLKKWEIKLTPDDEMESGKKLLKIIMQKFLPAADALLEMLILHLPSPATA
jgi:elongation factor 2